MAEEDIDGLVSSKIYKTLKWLGLIGCPLLGLAFGLIGPVWGAEDPAHSMVIIFLINLSIGLILAFSQESTAQQKEEKTSSN